MNDVVTKEGLEFFCHHTNTPVNGSEYLGVTVNGVLVRVTWSKSIDPYAYAALTPFPKLPQWVKDRIR